MTAQTTALAEVCTTLEKMEPQFKAALPAHIPVKKFLATAKNGIQNNPDIINADRRSLFLACQKAAQDGLILDGREAALVKFGKQAAYMPMVAGVLKKLRNSGQLANITAQIVHENDHFEYNPGSGKAPDHRPDWFGERGKMVGVYAVALLKDGTITVEVMNMDQINKVRNVSRASGDGPWKDWGEEMARKTVLRRIAKYLPSSSDLDQLFDHDNENYDLDPEPAPAPVKKSTKAADIIKAKASQEAAEDAEIIEGELEPEQEQVPEPAPEQAEDAPEYSEEDII